jgi:N6-adenosine-specific RNA methylase IME4
MKYRLLLADCPWNFSDSLTMSEIKRGAASVYNTLSVEDLKSLPVKDIAEDNSVLLLWCPSSLLQDGLDVMKAWGFRQTQTHIWVKTKKLPLRDYLKRFVSAVLESGADGGAKVGWPDINEVLAFGMGRLFRQTHELVLVGVRGKVYNHLADKSQRSVHFFPATKHSAKPDLLQDMLEKMFPGAEHQKIELFARRDKAGWTCAGLEAPSTLGEDIRVSIDRLKSL